MVYGCGGICNTRQVGCCGIDNIESRDGGFCFRKVNTEVLSCWVPTSATSNESVDIVLLPQREDSTWVQSRVGLVAAATNPQVDIDLLPQQEDSTWVQSRAGLLAATTNSTQDTSTSSEERVLGGVNTVVLTWGSVGATVLVPGHRQFG